MALSLCLLPIVLALHLVHPPTKSALHSCHPWKPLARHRSCGNSLLCSSFDFLLTAFTSRKEQGYTFDFSNEAPKHIPRAWERLPQSPHVARRKGRKVWKRPEPRSAIQTEDNEDQNTNTRSALRDLSTNASRIVKRQRLKSNAVEETRPEQKPKHYLATLKDAPLNTPKSTNYVVPKRVPCMLLIGEFRKAKSTC